MLLVMEKLKHISIQQYENDEEHMCFHTTFFFQVWGEKKMPLGFDRDCTGSVDCLGHCGHFTNINSSNQEHISFHLFLSTLISFINI